jgi:hypothetical protein
MHIFIYNDKVVKFDNYDNINQDKFMDILETEGVEYINQINNLHESTLNMRDNDIQNITDVINNIKKNQANNNKKIIDGLTEIFFKRCLEYVNNKNAVVYNEFLKYNKPSENKYYQQFL